MASERRSRTAQVERETSETQIRLTLNLDGTGRAEIDTGVGFFDHMLTLMTAHGVLDLEVQAEGDTHIDDHHTVEDAGIVLGQAVRQALGDKAGIRRYGHAMVPMDEALALVALDCSGRGLLVFDAEFTRDKIGTFDTELVEEFLRAVAHNAGMTLHVRLLAGANAHHQAEAIFKALGQALRAAVEPDPRREGIPSTKGRL
ncbi:MAG: Histidine biosynthesis bifunctional protein HisB [Anaerolineales bacterium]|nr:Histidine biosynthesis bifunctional protein HisB [Anaerolineales bacterium]